MKILLDTNVVLDLLMDRAPFADDAEWIFSAVEAGTIIGCLCGTTITTIHYLVAKALGARRACEEVGKLLALFEIAPVTRNVLEEALATDFNDFEDAVLYRAGLHAGAQALVTRNRKDFSKAQIPVYLPAEVTRLAAGPGWSE